MKFLQKSIQYLLILSALLFNVSCLNRHFIEGRAELVSITDTTLNDSSIFVGNVHQLEWPDNQPLPMTYEIWIDKTTLRTINDSTGYYFIKTIPGTYSIICQSDGNQWEQLIEVMKNVKTIKNKKIHIDFYIGYTVE